MFEQEAGTHPRVRGANAERPREVPLADCMESIAGAMRRTGVRGNQFVVPRIVDPCCRLLLHLSAWTTDSWSASAFSRFCRQGLGESRT
jgi:hypothetical protein